MANIGVNMDLQPLSGIEYIILVEIVFQQVLVLIFCLFMASHGHSLRRRCRNRREKNRSIKVDYIRSGWSVSHAFNECLSAILKLTPLLLVNPKPVLEDEIEDRWKWFEGCLGALDGTYIPIRVPIQHKPRYRTRKGEIATNVLGVCDRNLNFTYVLPGWEGSAADGRKIFEFRLDIREDL
uniref:DDE Tnp4 domain-containing protein n=1 Tax=Solanum lycopersicum TaxID=4081 RepID=A0A3Q7G404_SOLLC